MVTKDEFVELRNEVAEIKELLLVKQQQQTTYRTAPQGEFGDQISSVKQHKASPSWGTSAATNNGGQEMVNECGRMSMSQLLNTSPPRQQHQPRSYDTHRSDLVSSLHQQENMLAMSLMEKQQSAMQIDLTSKQHLIDGQHRQIYLLQQQLNLMSQQLEELAREKHITEVKLLKQSQNMNALQEENAMLKRHLSVQQTNLNHYRFSGASGLIGAQT